MVDQVQYSLGGLVWYIPAQDSYNIPLVENIISSSNAININTSTYPLIDITVTGINTPADSIKVINDDNSNALMFPVWVTANNGFQSTFVSSNKISFNPDSATLTTTTFNGDLTGTATNATNVTLTNTSTNANYYLPFANNNITGNYALGVDSGLYYNPSTNTLYATTFNGAFSGTATNADNIAITNDTTTNATMYPVWVTTNTGYLPVKVSSTKITFNPSTATLTTTTFSGALSGNASSSTYSTNANVTSTSTNASYYLPIITGNSSATYPLNVGSGITFNPSTNTLTTTTFSGSFSGTATNATNIATTATTTSASYYFPIITGNTTANYPPYVGSGLSFNPSTNVLTTTTFSGALSGNATTASSAAKWTTARLLAGNSVDGSANVPFANYFIVQGTADAGLTNAQFLGALGTGIVKNTTTTGILSIAIAADFPTLNQNTTGTAQYATNVALTATATNSNFYIPFASGNTTGNYGLGVDSGLYFNPSTDTLYATTFSGSFSGTVTNAVNIGITNDTTTNATMYPTWVTATTGYLPAQVSSTKIYFNPSTGTLSATNFISLSEPTLANHCVTKTYDDTRWIDIQRRGFVDNTQTSISFNDGTYTFTLTDATGGTGWKYLYSGIEYTITGNKTVILPGSPPAKGVYYIYIDATNGTLTQSTSAWSLLDTKVTVAIIYWDNALTPKYWLADERHSSLIDSRMHYYEHFTEGTRYLNGGNLTGPDVKPAVPTDLNNTFAIAATNIADEDLLWTLTALTRPNGTATDFVVFYRSGASTWNWVASAMPFYYTAAGYINYDSSGTMTEGTNNNYYNSYLLFCNISGSARYVIINGRSQFNTLVAAQAENPGTFSFTGLGIEEFIIAYQFTWSTSSGYTTKGKCRLEATPVRMYISAISTSISAPTTSHNSLSGLQGGLSPTEYYHLSSAQWTIATQAATGAVSGYLTSTDWTSFNTTINITNDTTTNASMYPVWVTTTTGKLPAYVSNTKIYFNPSTGLLTATGFSGPLTGNVTGNVSGSSGSCTGNAASATYASAATIVNDVATNADMFPTWVTANTGNLPLKVSSTQVIYHPSTGLFTVPKLSATDSTDSSSTITGAIVIAGGIGIAKNIYTGGDINLPTTTSTVGRLKVNGLTVFHTYPGTNIFLGNFSGNYTASGSINYAFGSSTLTNLTSGTYNLAFGTFALNALTSGSYNVACGFQPLAALLTGSYNIASGYAAGGSYTGAESSNIAIGNTGVTGESHVIRIGTQGSLDAQQNKAFIAGVYNTAVGATSNITLVDSVGQLGGLAGAANTVLIGGTAPSFSSTVPSAVLGGSTLHVGTTSIALNRASASQTLTGTSIDGASATSAVTDDTTTNATMYPVWVTANTGNLANYVSSTKLTYNPSTGIMNFASGGLTLATSGGTAATLNHNEVNYAHSSHLHGVYAVDISCTIYCSRIGNLVTLSYSTTSGTATIGTVITLVDALPTRFRPGNDNIKNVYIKDNSNNNPGSILVTTAGAVQWGNGYFSTNFTGSGTTGIIATSISYSV